MTFSRACNLFNHAGPVAILKRGMRHVHAALLASVLASALLCMSGCFLFQPVCVAHGSKVATPDGPRAIESLRVGDVVFTHGTQPQSVGFITWVRDARALETLELTLATGSTLRVTGEHPVAVMETSSGPPLAHASQAHKLRFVPAKELVVGMQVQTDTGAQTLLTIKRLSKATMVRDISVNPGETFYAQGVLVHNKRFANQPRPLTDEELAGRWFFIDGSRFSEPLEISRTGEVRFRGAKGQLPAAPAPVKFRKEPWPMVVVELVAEADGVKPITASLSRSFRGDVMPAVIYGSDRIHREVKLFRTSDVPSHANP